MAYKDSKYRVRKLLHRKTGYPVGTIAFYGPDDQIASKAVAGVILSEQDTEPTFMEKWYRSDSDARSDMEILVQMLEFFEKHNVRRVAMVDRIIGCPHEEGIDYPEGGTCPQCPFWANRDRWTGESTN